MPPFAAADLDAKRPVFGSKHFFRRAANLEFGHFAPAWPDEFRGDSKALSTFLYPENPVLENLGDYLRLPRPIWPRRDQLSARSTFSGGLPRSKPARISDACRQAPTAGKGPVSSSTRSSTATLGRPCVHLASSSLAISRRPGRTSFAGIQRPFRLFCTLRTLVHVQKLLSGPSGNARSADACVAPPPRSQRDRVVVAPWPRRSWRSQARREMAKLEASCRRTSATSPCLLSLRTG